jgi:hypothetical protein
MKLHVVTQLQAQCSCIQFVMSHVDDELEDFVIVGGLVAPAAVSGGSSGSHAPPSRAAKRARSTGLSQKVQQPGPLRVVAIVATDVQSSGSGLAIFTLGEPLCERLRSSRAVTGLPDVTINIHGEPDTLTLLGFVLMQSWQFVIPIPSIFGDSIQHELMKALTLQRKGVSGKLGFICIPIASGAALEKAITLPPELSSLAFTNPAFGRGIEHLVRGCDFMLRHGASDPEPDAQTARTTYAECLQIWHDEFGLQLDACVPLGWKVWGQVGEVMVRAAWPGDVVSVSRCDKVRPRLTPNHPPRMAELHYLENCVTPPNLQPNAVAPSSFSEAEFFCTSSKFGPAFKQFHPIHLVNALSAGADLKSQSLLKRSVGRHFALAFPTDHMDIGRVLTEKGFLIPTRRTLERARVRLDVVSMLVWQLNRPRSIISRTLSFDSSPQGGLELFASAEICVVRGEDGSASDCIKRSQVLTQMGHGQTGVAAKTMNLIHKVALDVGFDKNMIRTWFDEVRVCVTDLGGEWSVADMPDYIDEYLSSMDVKVPNRDVAIDHLTSRGYLMPNAVRYAGWSHSHYWILSKALHTLSFWVDYLQKARVLCWFLNYDAYRDVLVQTLREKAGANPDIDFQWDPKDAETFHANFAHWRFGTVARVSKRLSFAEVWLKDSFDPVHFVLKDSVKMKEVCNTIASETFWKQNRIVMMISGHSENARKWGLGCHCHAQELMDAARHGVRVDCWKKCMMAPQLRSQLQIWYLQWQHEVMVMSPETCGSLNLCHEAQHCLRSLVSWTRFRFSFVEHIPWLISEARDPAIAKQCIAEYTRQQAAFDRKTPGSCQPHRVSLRFCGRGSVLQEGFRRHAEGGVMSSVVNDEVSAYEHAFIDESRAEGEHRNATYQRKRATSSTFPWWASSCRLDQNIAIVEASKARDGGLELTALWYRWKAVLQTRARAVRSLQPKRINTKSFIDRVYRLRSVGLEDWSEVSGPHKSKTVGAPKDASKDAFMRTTIVRDFCRCSLKDDTFYTIPQQSASAAVDADESLAPSLWPTHRPEAGSRSFTCFQILSTTPGLLTSAVDMCTGFQVPIYIQWHVPHGLPMFDVAVESLDVYPDGDPVVVDATQIAGIRELHTHLNIWKERGLSDVGGCTELRMPIHFRLQDWPDTVRGFPLYEMFQMLADQGWSKGDRSEAHEPNSLNKIMDVPRNCVAIKAYYRCLLTLQRLFDAGLPQLHTKQTGAYYELCLRSNQKALILPGRPATEYNALLQIDGTNGIGLLEIDNVGLIALGIQDGLDDDDMDGGVIVGGLVLGPQPPPQPLMDAAVGSATPLAVGPATPLASHVVSVQHPSSTPSVQQHGREVVIEFSDSDSSEEGLSNEPPSSSSGSVPPVPIPLFGPPAPDSYPEFLCGVRVCLETTNPSNAAPYNRLVVTCPLSSSSHKGKWGCQKSRILSGKSTSRFGNIEAAGYLGAWLENASKHGAREGHMSFAPTDMETEAFLRKENLL